MLEEYADLRCPFCARFSTGEDSVAVLGLATYAVLVAVNLAAGLMTALAAVCVARLVRG